MQDDCRPLKIAPVKKVVAMKEPWGVDKNSLDWKMLNGWMSSFFEEWLVKTGQKCTADSEEVLVGVAETIRMTSYETLQRLRKNTPIPPFIITENLTGDLAIIKTLAAGGSSPEIFCHKEIALRTMSPFALLLPLLAGFSESLRTLQDGKRIVGGSNDVATAYFSTTTQRAFDSVMCSDESDLKRVGFVNTVIEETIHFFDHQHHPELMEKFYKIVPEELQKANLADPSCFSKFAEDDLKQELEERILHIKTRVSVMSQLFVFKKIDFFAPFKKHCKLPLY